MPWKPLPSTGGREPRSLGDALDEILRSIGAPTSDVMGTVFQRWDALVGERMAAHVQPVSLRRGRLVVSVDDPAWASQLTWIERDVIERLNAELGTDSVTTLDVRVRP